MVCRGTRGCGVLANTGVKFLAAGSLDALSDHTRAVIEDRPIRTDVETYKIVREELWDKATLDLSGAHK